MRWPFPHSPPTTTLSIRDLSGGTSLWTGKHVLFRVLVISSFASRRWNTSSKTVTCNSLSLSLWLTKPPGTYMSNSTGEHLKESQVCT